MAILIVDAVAVVAIKVLVRVTHHEQRDKRVILLII
jgi:hypothetical protein